MNKEPIKQPQATLENSIVIDKCLGSSPFSMILIPMLIFSISVGILSIICVTILFIQNFK